ncbi:hypothetical protein ACIRPT_38355 [Streptomyces sp. NPDC101227]|uniref:hypothetical protein n=1 Tax=Streptomyces sp. NPDC101227 TaxID=3366136 RepID=UPI0038215733
MAAVSLWDLAESARARVKEEASKRPGVVQELMLLLGECPSGPTTNMEEVTHWKIVFNDFPAPTDNESPEEVELWSYEADGDTSTGEINDIEVHQEEFLGNSAIHGTVTMTPEEAFKILCQYRQKEEPFQWVSLRLPPSSGHVGYNFLYDPLGNKGWAVNIDNRKVINW